MATPNLQPISFRYEFEYRQPPPLNPGIRASRPIVRIICHGSLVAQTAHCLEDLGRSLTVHPNVILDLLDVSYIDSDGLDLLIRLRLWAFLLGVQVEIANLSPQVLQLTSIPNLSNSFLS